MICLCSSVISLAALIPCAVSRIEVWGRVSRPDCTTTNGVTKCTGTEVVGGDKAAVFNAEIAFPVMEQYGLRGVAFFDAGNSFNSFNFQ